MERVRKERTDPEREPEEGLRAAPPAPATALLALQRTAGNRATAAHLARLRRPQLQRQITLGTTPLTAQQASQRVSVLLSPRLDAAKLAQIDTIIGGYDTANRVFADEKALVAAIQGDIDATAAPFEVAVPTNAQTVLMLPDFRALAGGYNLPPSTQHDLAAAIQTDAHMLELIYAKLTAKVIAGTDSAESIMKWFTAETRAFTIGVIREGMSLLSPAHRPTAPFSVVMAGSGAREEMFPGSDLDVSPITDVPDQAGVAALFSFMQYVEKRLMATMDFLRLKLGRAHPVGLGPDTGVYPFAKTPEELAAKALEMQNTGQDAMEIYKSPGGQGLTKRFEQAREGIAVPKHTLGELRTRLTEFPPVDLTGAKKIDIKKGFLRFPTLVLRELAQFFDIPATNSFDRVRMLVSNGHLDGSLGDGVLRALETISSIRLRLHVHYREEIDTAATADAHKTAPTEYVLSLQELRGLTEAQLALALFRDALTKFVESNGKAGLKKGKLESLKFW